MDNLSVKLKIGSGVEFSTHPVFGSDVKLQLTRESEQIFRREKLSGTFRFVGKDFDLIASISANIEFRLEFYRGEELIGRGAFYKTDCKMDYDNRICEVSMTTTDKYEKIMNGMNNKFNLIKLAPKMENAILSRRAVLQLYTKGEDTLTNIVGGVHFEQDCQEVNDSQTLRNTYFFGSPLPLMTMMIEPSLTESIPMEASGLYQISGFRITEGQDVFIFSNSNNYRIEAIQYAIGFRIRLRLRLLDPQGIELGEESDLSRDEFFTLGEHPITFSLMTTIVANGTQYFQGEVFARILTPEVHQSGHQRPTEDITEYNSNYRGIITVSPEDLFSYIQSVMYKTTEPTEWGIDSNGKYFMAPELTPAQKTQGIAPIPFGRSHWELLSTWLMSDRNLSLNIDRYSDTFELKDAYSVANCIKVLLGEIDPDISFAEDTEHSIFLAPRDAEQAELIDAFPFPRTRESRLFLSQITNIKRTRYEQAAQRGDITLKQILDMLRNVYQCYWWVDEYSRLRIEHISYFKNGMSYVDRFASPQIDLAQMTSLPTRKSWEYNTNTLQGEKSKCPARYEFGWGDSQTIQFNGYAIDIEDKYIDHSKTEKITIENIVSDLDYIIINPSGVSDDLFALLEVQNVSREVVIAEVRLSNTSPLYRLQNGFCSFIFAEANYYPYDLGGWKAKANGEALSVIGTRAFKSQELSFPITLEQARSVEFIRTDMGIGELESIDIDADTLHATAKVLYGEKQDPTNDLVVTHTETPFPNRTAFYVTNNADIPMKVTLTWYEPLRTSEIFYEVLQPHEDRLIGERRVGSSTLVLLKAEDASIVEIGRPNVTYGTQMECVVTYGQDQGKDYCQIDFDGHQEEQPRYEHTWGLCSILAKKDLRISCLYSTEDDYDFAWANETPCITSEAARYARYQGSGDGSFSFTLPKGESICIGYTKDVDTYENTDLVRFTMREL